MSEPVRWGILRGVKFARQQLGLAIHAAHGAELAALATSNVSKSEAFQACVSGLQVHRSDEAVLADPDIDALYIPLPNHLHL